MRKDRFHPGGDAQWWRRPARAVRAEETRLDAVEALLAADVFLAAEGGEARFEQADLLDDVARLWLVATPRTLPASMLASASAADLGYAVDVVLACEGSTPANIRRVLDACIAAGRRSSPEGRFAQEQIQYLEEALAELEAPVAAV